MNLIDRVRTTIREHHLFSPGDIVVVGVSGGPDSLTLLHVLRALHEELQISLHVAHLNHLLRGEESDADAEFVAHLAREWNLPATIGARDVASIAGDFGQSVEECGRLERYVFLIQVAQEIDAHVIAVAHHADDQVETVLMHLLRGTGLAGLRGISYRMPTFSDVLWITRPLLDVPRAEIVEYCYTNGLAPRIDSSNSDNTFFRNRLRNETLPYLETLNPNLREILRRTARSITEDYDFLQTQVRDVFARVAHAEYKAVVFQLDAWRALHPALQRGTLRMAFHHLNYSLRDTAWTHVENARRIVLEKSTGAQATLPHNLMLTIAYNDFVIADANAPRDFDAPQLFVDSLALAIPGITPLPDSDWSIETEIADAQPVAPDRWTAILDADKCRGEISLRTRRAGDRFEPAGLGNTKSLREFFIDTKIPRALRNRLPLLMVDNQIGWVCGWRVDEHVRATESTKRFLRVTCKRKSA